MLRSRLGIAQVCAVLLVCVFSVSSVNADPSSRDDLISRYGIPMLPEWTDKYREIDGGDKRFFELDDLMSGEGLTRLQAVEVQNHYRDLAKQREEIWVPNNGDFVAALQKVKDGQFERAVDLEALQNRAFIVVFDLDETLYDQWRGDESCSDFQRPDGEGTKYLKMVPGWENVIRRVVELGGAVVIYSANGDEGTNANLRAIKLSDGTSLYDTPLVSGVFTNSHLVRLSKDRKRVMVPSKDLRIFDESLAKVILVDDSPSKVIQQKQTRVGSKFYAPAYCNGTRAVKRSMERFFETLLAEIEDSLEYAQANDVSFADAFLPYSVLGRLAVEQLRLVEPHRNCEGCAIQVVRDHPGVVGSKL